MREIERRIRRERKRLIGEVEQYEHMQEMERGIREREG